MGGEAGGGRGQHQPQVALAEEADQASIFTDREMTNTMVLHQAIRRVHGRLGRHRERRWCHQIPDTCRQGPGMCGVIECMGHWFSHLII